MSDAWKKYYLFSDLLQIYKEEEEQFKDYVNFLCSKNYTVVLFGSRARGDFKIYSDYDLLVIGKDLPKFPPTDAIQLHFYKKEKVDKEIEEFNTVIIDAFYEGKLLCDKLNIYEEKRRKVLERIRGLKRVKDGWMRE